MYKINNFARKNIKFSLLMFFIIFGGYFNLSFQQLKHFSWPFLLYALFLNAFYPTGLLMDAQGKNLSFRYFLGGKKDIKIEKVKIVSIPEKNQYLLSFSAGRSIVVKYHEIPSELNLIFKNEINKQKEESR